MLLKLFSGISLLTASQALALTRTPPPINTPLPSSYPKFLKLKAEGEATVASLKEDTSSLRRELQQEQHEREKADESNRSLTADVEELREVQNELLETIREKTKAVSKATREVTALQREKDASEGEVSIYYLYSEVLWSGRIRAILP